MFRWFGRWSRNRAARGLRGYAICTAPRSGSNLLCEWLTSTGILGRPLEYFNGPGRRALTDPNYPDDRRAQIKWILTKGSTSNEIYGVKLFAYNHAEISPVIDWTRALPGLVYVYLERRDRLGQAISWVRALQTQQYRSTQPAQGVISYDGAAIRERLDALDREYMFWSDFFSRHRLQPLRLFYEEVVQNPQCTVDRVAAHVGLDDRALFDGAAIDLVIQRDVTTAEWRARYLGEFGEPPRHRSVNFGQKHERVGRLE